ncbi:MAG: hypothetical protein CVU39_10025 [Chloroflexi bacterium HGW-Chloroflexi-10]|nr:MAG: hypothetical protein CVU39_10025 [Chloroflexi bacterium HGW-Chloroflexi-10]
MAVKRAILIESYNEAKEDKKLIRDGDFCQGCLFSMDVSAKYNLEGIKILPREWVIGLADTCKTYKIHIGTIGW